MKQSKGVKEYPYQSGDIRFRKDNYGSAEEKQALEKAFDYIIQKDSYGGHKIKGNYLIAYSLEFARNLTFSGDGDPQWHELRDENAHIGVAVHDASDFHFIKGLRVTVTVIDQGGFPVGSFDHPYLDRPDLCHYGRNWKLPGDGKYTLQIRVEAPQDMALEKNQRKTGAAPVEVKFRNVTIKTGQKVS